MGVVAHAGTGRETMLGNNSKTPFSKDKDRAHTHTHVHTTKREIEKRQGIKKNSSP